jgi:hypothetical protein
MMDTKNQAQQFLAIKDLEFVSAFSANEQEEGLITGGNAFSDFFTKDIPNGVKRIGKGIKDGSRNDNPRYDDLWYNLGYGGGKFLD